jgi:hypothetical protein
MSAIISCAAFIISGFIIAGARGGRSAIRKGLPWEAFDASAATTDAQSARDLHA